MKRPLLYGILLCLAVIAAGCARSKTVMDPPAPATPRPAPSTQEPPAPPPLLAPQAGSEALSRQKQEAEAKIDGAEDMLRRIDQQRLVDEQQEIFSIIQSFLSNARKALSIGDFLRAVNLAEKAQILAQDLLRAPRWR